MQLSEHLVCVRWDMRISVVPGLVVVVARSLRRHAPCPVLSPFREATYEQAPKKDYDRRFRSRHGLIFSTAVFCRTYRRHRRLLLCRRTVRMQPGSQIVLAMHHISFNSVFVLSSHDPLQMVGRGNGRAIRRCGWVHYIVCPTHSCSATTKTFQQLFLLLALFSLL